VDHEVHLQVVGTEELEHCGATQAEHRKGSEGHRYETNTDVNLTQRPLRLHATCTRATHGTRAPPLLNTCHAFTYFRVGFREVVRCTTM
jgi:hypothetical protein